MIYNYSNTLTWTGTTPPLLVALRPDAQLYTEAVSFFYKHNTFKLHRGNDWTTGSMSPSALQTILRLRVDFWSSEDFEEWDTSQIIEPATHNFAAHPVMAATNLREVFFNVSSLSEYNMSACLLPSVTLATRLPHLQRITVELPRSTYHRSDDPYDKSGMVESVVRDFNHYLGVRGKLVAVDAGIGGRQVWFWEGDKGRALCECVEGAMREWRAGVRRGSADYWNSYADIVLRPVGASVVV
jgi:hypothetical protein